MQSLAIQTLNGWLSGKLGALCEHCEALEVVNSPALRWMVLSVVVELPGISHLHILKTEVE